MRCIIAGTRTATRAETIEAIHASGFADAITVVVSGMAKGADTHGLDWALNRLLPTRHFPANWALYGTRAGPIRNRLMADNADALIAVWDGKSKGTENMIAEAEKRGLRVYVHRTDGK